MQNRICPVVILLLAVSLGAACGPSEKQREVSRKRLLQLGYDVPVDRLGKLRELDLSGLRVSDSDLAELKYLSGLERLNLSQTGITDAGMETIGRFKALVQLNLDSTAISDKALKQVARLKNIESLSLKRTQISDTGIEAVSTLPALRELHVSHTRLTDQSLESLRATRKTLQELNLIETLVTDAGLRHLSGFNRLQTLYLKDTQVTDAGLKHLLRIRDLRRLGLGNTRITDTGLKTIASMDTIETLYIDQTRISDHGLRNLAELKTLTLVNVAKTKATPKGALALKRILPRVGIVLDAPPAAGFQRTARKGEHRPTDEKSEMAARVPATTPPTYVPKIRGSFSADDYPEAARAANIGWVSIGVRLHIAPNGAIEKVSVLHVRSSKAGATPFESEFAAAAKRVFERAKIENPPGGNVPVTYETRVVFKLN